MHVTNRQLIVWLDFSKGTRHFLNFANCKTTRKCHRLRLRRLCGRSWKSQVRIEEAHAKSDSHVRKSAVIAWFFIRAPRVKLSALAYTWQRLRCHNSLKTGCQWSNFDLRLPGLFFCYTKATSIANFKLELRNLANICDQNCSKRKIYTWNSR